MSSGSATTCSIRTERRGCSPTRRSYPGYGTQSRWQGGHWTTRSVELNLVAQYAFVRASAARIASEAPDGDRSITVFSSINALRGYGMPGYSAAKAGLLGLVVALALPLGRRGLRINALTPGTVLTERFREAYSHSEELGPRLVESAASTRATRVEDVAEAVRAVLNLRQMTGQQLVIDGGQLAVPFDHYPLA